MSIIHFQEALKIFRTLRTTLHRKKIDDLNEQQRLPLASLTDNLGEFAQSGDKTIVADSKQRTTRNITHACRFDDQHTRPPLREPAVPVEILLRHKSIFRRAPGHHRRHPRAAARLEFADGNRAEEPRARRFFSRGPARLKYLVPDWIRKFPHVLVTQITGLHRSEEHTSELQSR